MFCTRLCRIHNLVFFLLVLVASCGNKEEAGIKVVWVDGKASALYLPKSLFGESSKDSLSKFLRISLKGDTKATSILGNLNVENNIIFEPALPFTTGSSYEVFYQNNKVGEFGIPAADDKKKAEVLESFPSLDTLPENVLKLYLAFSAPMREGQSEKYITLIKNNSDTLKGEFLNLQPELWNANRMVLTIWFDPGRIKRDLQPNLKLGAPLKQSEHYKLLVSHEWPDARGVTLAKDFTKEFITGTRDSLSPATNRWEIQAPIKNSFEALVISADETLDHYLFAECLHVTDASGKELKGSFETDDDRVCRFIPVNKWTAGKYYITVDAKLEDLAGNNLNRPFDRDMLTTKEPESKASYEISFIIPGTP